MSLEDFKTKSAAMYQAIQSGSLNTKGCVHLAQVEEVTPSSAGCEECLKIGDTWVHLRMCLICGKVGCCDNSKNKHATKHFHDSGHALIMSMESWEDWIWCYLDEKLIRPRR